MSKNSALGLVVLVLQLILNRSTSFRVSHVDRSCSSANLRLTLRLLNHLPFEVELEPDPDTMHATALRPQKQGTKENMHAEGQL